MPCKGGRSAKQTGLRMGDKLDRERRHETLEPPLFDETFGKSGANEAVADTKTEPARYGEDDAGEGPFDPDRDRMMRDLVQAVIAAQRPLFGICRGFQDINVALGGTLRRDTATNGELLRHHTPDGTLFDAMFDHRHHVDLVEGGMLASAYGASALDVNSVHYQGVGRLGDGLAVEARAPDGLVEAFSARPNGAPLLAVQWHPEWSVDGNEESQTYFRLLGQALRGNL